MYVMVLDLGLPEIRIPRPRSVVGTHAKVSASWDIFSFFFFFLLGLRKRDWKVWNLKSFGLYNLGKWSARRRN